MNTDDPDELVALFDNTLRSLLDRHAPVKHKNITIRPCVPWMNEEIILAKRQRRKAEYQIVSIIFRMKHELDDETEKRNIKVRNLDCREKLLAVRNFNTTVLF